MPNRYPQEASLRDGRRVLIRPFAANDGDALWEFFQRLPADTRRFAWDRIDDRAVVDNWCRMVDFSKAFPLLAFDHGKIIADATLHRRDGGPLRHVGRIKWLIDPEYRRVGVGTALIHHFINLGRDNGLRHLSCMLASDLEADAIKTLLGLGFSANVVPNYAADPDGFAHNMTFMVLSL